jgi:F-type H+-transporting ATPase subunit gamma
MPSLIDLRRRIRAVKSTQQITKAMKMIAASRLKRAQDRVVSARPFARRMLAVLNSLVSRVEADAHPLLRMPDQSTGRPLLIVITADRGLCGSFNSNVIKAAGQFITNDAQGREVALGLVGRKGRDFFRRRGFDVRYEAAGIFQKLSFTDAQQLADTAIEEFTSGNASSVYLVYNEFKSVIQQRIAIERLLPIERHVLNPQQPRFDYIYEPEPAGILKTLLPRHVEVQIWKALLESNAAEHGARMASMDAATNNASEMIDSLTLYMNKVRQAAITKEIIEVVSGAGSPG